MQLLLGAAQFGMPYGITRDRDAVTQSALDQILRVAQGAGVAMVDTAPGYGDSEVRLGRALRDRDLPVQTKTAPLAAEAFDVVAVREGFERSLQRLGRVRVESLLVHGAHHLLGPHGEALVALLETLRESGLAARVGVSVYDPQQLARVREVFRPDVVQLPLSAADQRFTDGRALEDLARDAILIQARSVFLQGTLLSAPDALPPSMQGLADAVRGWHGGVEDAAAACFGFLHGLGMVDEVVVGVHSEAQLRTLLQAWRRPAVDLDWAGLRFADALVDPRGWPAP